MCIWLWRSEILSGFSYSTEAKKNVFFSYIRCVCTLLLLLILPSSSSSFLCFVCEWCTVSIGACYRFAREFSLCTLTLFYNNTSTYSELYTYILYLYAVHTHLTCSFFFDTFFSWCRCFFSHLQLIYFESQFCVCVRMWRWVSLERSGPTTTIRREKKNANNYMSTKFIVSYCLAIAIFQWTTQRFAYIPYTPCTTDLPSSLSPSLDEIRRGIFL